jgi:hypothetical protein
LKLEPQLFLGDASDAEARVYAVLPRAGLCDDARLEGELVGPRCRYSQTLPGRIRFVDRGPGPTLLAEAIVPDPCFWTPDLPFLYSVELRLAGVNAATAQPFTVKQPFGIRRLGAHQASIFLDARRFVPRGVSIDDSHPDMAKAARDAASALYLDDPADDFLREASEEGVVLAVSARQPKSPDPLRAELIRLSRWPAVAMVVLDSDLPAGRELRLAARNTLLAQRIIEGNPSPTAVCPWAHLLWWEIDRSTTTAAPPHDVPIVVYRTADQATSLAARRRACDDLQVNLAPLGDFAGYFV